MKLDADTFGYLEMFFYLKYDFTEPVDSKSGRSSAEIQTGDFSLIG